jgi:threonylcarbamoyladenosine tRNA methylthiotransferase MtaB
MKIAFKTFGCKANSVDTDSLYFEARRRGFDIVDEAEVADAYVINSCTVTGAADRDARYYASRYKRQNPNALVGVIGCYAQVAKDELLALEEVDFVLGTADKGRILEHFGRAWAAEAVARDQVQPTLGYLPEAFPGSRHSRASVKIQDGCNFSCSFCIIPQARGRSRSLAESAVLAQIDEAYAQGFREVILTGIHIAHYGWDRGTDLLSLLRRIFERARGPRIRVSTLDPFEVPDELIAMLGQEQRLCPHFHIALQSGSDTVLKGMRRIYKAAEFIEVTGKIGARNPDTFIGVDVIAGFHGEGEAEFRQTLDCLEKSYWTKLHVFPFSVRRGTRAESLPEGVPGEAIAERSRVLRELSEARYAAFLRSQLGKPRDVLLERPWPRESGVWQGHTENYLPTLSRVEPSEGIAKAIVRSEITALAGEKVWTRSLGSENSGRGMRISPRPASSLSL